MSEYSEPVPLLAQNVLEECLVRWLLATVPPGAPAVREVNENLFKEYQTK